MQTTAVTLKNKLRVKRPLLGGFVFSGDPNIPEIYAECGFDFVIIDTEHALNDLRSVHAHLRACAAAGIHAIVRLGVANFPDAPRLLDAGAEGIMIPHLGHGTGTKELLASMKYWPEGSRPTCTGVQMAGYGLRNFGECAERSNRDVLSIGLVEDQECVDSIDRVLDETRVDWIMPGPADLASSLGLHGKLTHPTVRAAVETIIAEAHRKNIAIGIYVNEPVEIADWLDKGISFFVYSIDYKVLGKSLRTAASACREAFAATSDLTKASHP
jgi:2-keto-3-deoxy-L-rhamnonate aldolase RhmA